jgi:hypothetical protein
MAMFGSGSKMTYPVTAVALHHSESKEIDFYGDYEPEQSEHHQTNLPLKKILK